jgi:hypothetical protein
VFTPESLEETERINVWLASRRGWLDALARKRDTLMGKITQLKGKPLLEPTAPREIDVLGNPIKSRVTETKTPSAVADLKPIGDIDSRILGEFSVETKPYLFDRIDKVMPGTKDSVYWRQKQLEKTSLEEVQSLTNTSREWERGLPNGSSRDIMVSAVNAQKGGPAILEAMGIKDVPTLGPAQEAALGKLRNSFDEIFPRLNEARVAAGKEPIDAVENYFTFFRQLNTAAKENLTRC